MRTRIETVSVCSNIGKLIHQNNDLKGEDFSKGPLSIMSRDLMSGTYPLE